MIFIARILGNQPRHTVEGFSSLHTELLNLLPITPHNKDQAIEAIRAISEQLIWSDQNQGGFFRHAIDTNLLRLFWTILIDSKPQEVHIQLIQSATLLIHNLSSDKCKKYLLNTLFYRDVVCYSYDFSDEDIVENYISMLKAFAVNLKAEMLSEYLANNNFALLTGTMMFMNYHESMIKTAARTVILSIFKLKPKNIKDYIIQSGFFNCFIASIGEKLSQCNKHILKRNSGKLEKTLAEIYEDLYYIHDIYDLQINEFEDMLTNLLMKNLIYPIAIGSLLEESKGPFCISIPLAEIFLCEIVRVVKHVHVVNSLVLGLLVRKIPGCLVELLSEIPSPNLRPDDGFLDVVISFLDYLDGFTIVGGLVDNPVPDILFGFIKSQDCELICITITLIHSIITCPTISSNLLQESGIMYFEKVKTKNYIHNVANESRLNIYNKNIVEQLLRLLLWKEPLKVFHFQITCKCIMSLSYCPELNRCLSDKHRKLLNKAFGYAVESLRVFLEDNSDYDVFFEVFEDEWKKINSSENKIQSTINLILPNNSDDSQIPLYQRSPKDDIEELRCNIQRFYSLWSLKFSLDNNKKIFPLEKYPLYFMSNACSWEKHKSYHNSNKNYAKCTVKLNKNDQSMYFISDPDFFLLVIPDNKSHKGNYDMKYICVKYVECHLNIDVITDRADPRRLVIFTKRQNDVLEVVFDDTQKCLWAFKEITNSHVECKERYVILINKLFCQLLSCN
ncbi:hypothetical protein SteCoe_25248 [Stentor coeruleus]|uniref:FPL domain-containing protein n=1 Tax=Stentor coeruleus TaxID=5963 RepID=A0A1R2BFP5_9CILI|nr:hypothetical protein SteCoe_25248 [Stentor coeruleus]